MKLRLALAALLLTSTSAFAADLAPQPVEPAAPVYVPFVWTGFYAGVHAGVVGSDVKASQFVSDVSSSFNNTGFIGGAHAGYNYQFDGGFVLGAEADIDYTSLSKTNTGGNGLVTARFRSDLQGSIRARAGYAFDRIMPYVTGGVAFADEKFSLFSAEPVFGVFGGSSNSDRVGWTLGGGLEYALTDNWLLRGEVRYTDFGSKDFDFAGAGAVKVRFQETSGTLGVSYKF